MRKLIFIVFSLCALLSQTELRGQTAQVINVNGGTGLTDGLKVVVNTNGALSVYRDNQTQYYSGYTWPDGQGSGVSLTFRFDNGSTYNATKAYLTACSTTPVQQTGNTYTTSITGYVTSTISSKRFYVTLNVSYTYPNKYFLIDYIIRAPSDLGTAETVHMYLDHDAFILGSDASKGYRSSNGEFVGDYRTSTADNCTNMRAKNARFPSAHGFKTKNGFRSYFTGDYSSRSTINSNLMLSNTVNTTCIDDGVAVEFTVGPLSAGQIQGKGVLHCYGDNLSELENLTVNDPTITTSTNTPVTVNFTSATFSETEGSTTHTTSTVKVRVSGGIISQPQVLNITCTNGTASQSTHYTYVKGFTIPAGNYTTAQDFILNNINIVGNTTCNDNLTFTASIDNSTACNDLIIRGTTNPTTTITIVDDETRPTITSTLPNLTYEHQQSAPAITVVTNPTGATVRWTNSNTSIGLAANGTGTIPAFTATNTTSTPITATITVTPEVSCTGTPKTFTITVNPKYTITYVYNGGNAPATANPTTYVYGPAFSIVNTPTRTGYTFRGWTCPELGITTPTTPVNVPANTTGNLTLTADWGAPNTYAITYTLYGGTVEPPNPNPSTYDITTPAFTLKNPVRVGYTFTGWTGSNGSTPQMTITVPQGSTGAREYSANWSINTYTIGYNFNTGVAPTTANKSSFQITEVPFTINTTATANQPTKTGYDFTGWTGHDITTPNKTINVSNTTFSVAGVPENLSYTANWSTHLYSITYTLNDGIPSSPNPSGYTIESAAITLNNPTRLGYTFTGWTGSNGSSPQTTVTIAAGSTGDKTYTANFTRDTYTIGYTLTTPNGSAGTITGTPNPTTYHVETATFTLTNPTHPGYTFKGWSGTGLTGDNNMTVTIPVGSTGARTYVAHWAIESANNFNISYTLTTPTTPELIDVPANPTTYNIETNTITLINPSHPGYTFKGWTGSNGTTPQLTVTIPKGSTGDRSYTANWALESSNSFPITYTVATTSAPGLVVVSPPNPTSYNVETATFTLTNPTHPGYTFKGWSGTGLTGTNNMTVTIPQGSTGARTYVANWAIESANEFTISYILTTPTTPELTTVPANPTTYNVETNTITLINPSHPGYTFKGWSGTGLTGTNNMTVTIPKGSTGDRTYTAHWALESSNSFNISYTLTTPTTPTLVVVSPANPTTYNVETATFTLTNPTHPGYTFKGWSGTGLTGTNNMTVTIPKGSTGDRSYTAHWALEPTNDFNIAYTLTTPTTPEMIVIPNNPVTYNVETATFTLINPSHPGYTFKGWSGTGLTGTNNMTVTIAKGSTGDRAYTANWAIEAANNFTITYNLDGGTVAGTNPTSYNVETPTFALINPTREGYTFAGWTGSNGTTPQTSVSVAKGSTGAKNFTANWEVTAANAYAITYTLTTPNNQSGVITGTPNPVQYFVNTPTFTLTNPTHPGYTFKGWSGTGLTGTNNMTVTIPIGSTGARSYTAHWAIEAANNFPISYTLTTPTTPELIVVPANPTSYNIETNTITLINPSHPGYTFKGWTGSNGTTPQLTVTIPKGSTGSRSYTANWALESTNDFTISYTVATPTTPNLVVVSPANPTSYNVETNTITLTNPTHPGYTFKGWSGTGLTGTNNMTVTIPKGSIGDRSYTAHWAIESANNFTISYTVATPTVPGLVVVSPPNPTSYNIETPTITLTNPTHPGYTFTGWSGTDLTGNGNMTVTIPVGSYGPRSYTAHWTLDAANDFNLSYTLTAPNGSEGVISGTPNPAKYNIETTTFTLTNPTHPGYSFTGWSGTDLTGNANMSVTINKGSTGDRSFTAHWSLLTFNITYDYDGGTATNPATYTTETASFTLQTPVRSGYTFTGWSGTGLTGNANMTVIIPVGSSGNRSYTAHWSLNSYSISYDAGGGNILSAIPSAWLNYTVETLPTGIDITPVRLGYTFKGWEGHGLSGQDSPFDITTATPGVPGDLHFTASWAVDVYNITYDPNGGAIMPGNPTTYSIEQYPVLIAQPPVHLDPDYTFIGWTSPQLTSTPMQITYSLPVGTLMDLTMKANWVRKLDDLNGGVNDTLYLCESSKQLLADPQGISWEWTLPDGTIRTQRDISANKSGRYTVRTDYGTIVLADTLYVYFIGDVSARIDYVSTRGAKVERLQEFVLRLPPEITAYATADWSLTGGGTIVSSSADSLKAIWSATGEKIITVRLTFSHGLVTCMRTLSTKINIGERGRGYFVNQNVSGGLQDGSSWENAYRTLEEALDPATPGDYIWVAKGTYRVPTGGFVARQDSISVFGGFAGSEEYLYERNTSYNPTILEGNYRSHVITIDNCVGVRLDGFTITKGSDEDGGGVYFANGATGQIANCFIINNTATNRGGGIYMGAPWYGYTTPELINSEVSGNTANDGAGIYNTGSNLYMLNVTVSGNKAAKSGGGLYNEGGGSPIIHNTIIWGNLAAKGTDVANISGAPSYRYSLIGGSTTDDGKWDPTFGYDGGNNRDVSPLFITKGYEADGVTMRTGNYHLSASSIAVDQGNNSLMLGTSTPWDIFLLEPRASAVAGIVNDLDYMTRIADSGQGERIDMGAYELNASNFVIKDIMRRISLPEVEGATLDPGHGIYYVQSKEHFTFTITPDAQMRSLYLNLSTSRNLVPDHEGVVIEKGENGVYTVTILAVQDYVEVFISFTNTPADNLFVPGTSIYSYKGKIYVRTDKTSEVEIYDLAGMLVKRQKVSTGETAISMQPGVYIVTLNGARQKVIIR